MALAGTTCGDEIALAPEAGLPRVVASFALTLLADGPFEPALPANVPPDAIGPHLPTRGEACCLVYEHLAAQIQPR